MFLSRTARRLLVASIVLFALSGAAGALRDGFQDLYRLGDCGAGLPGQGTDQCVERRLLWAAAEAGTYLLRIPAIALVALGALAVVLERRTAMVAAAGEAAGFATQPGAEAVPPPVHAAGVPAPHSPLPSAASAAPKLPGRRRRDSAVKTGLRRAA